MKVISCISLASIAPGGIPMGIRKHGGQKVTGSKDFKRRKAPRKMPSTSAIMACLKDFRGLGFTYTTAENSINTTTIQPVCNDCIMPAIDSNLPSLIGIQMVGEFLCA